MRRIRGRSSEHHAFASLLNSCANLRDAEAGSALHADICRLALMTNLFIASSLIRMYASCGSLAKAQEAFDMLTCRNVVTWNALMAASYSKQSEHGEKSMESFGRMQLEGLVPDAFSFALALKACSASRAVDKGIQIHAKICALESVEGDPYIGTSLIDMHANCGLLDLARDVFDELLSPDATSWNALIGGYVKCGYGEEALNCFHQMQDEGLSPTSVTYACTLKACCRIGAACIEKAQQIHDEIVRSGSDREMFVGSSLVDMYSKHGLLMDAQRVFDKLAARSAVSWNCLIAGYVKHGCNEEALRCFELMQMQKLEEPVINPTTVTFVCSLKACSNMGSMDKGTQIQNAIARLGLQSNVFIASALVDMYATCGFLEKAHQLFGELPLQIRASSMCCKNALVAGYAQFGEMGALFQILSMPDLDHEQGGQMIPSLNSVTMISILNACSHGGLVDYAIEAMVMMMISGCGLVTREHYNCLVDVLGRAGQVERAIYVVTGMPFHPNLVVWHTVLGACRKYGYSMDVAWIVSNEIVRIGEVDSPLYVLMPNDMYTTHDVIMVEAIQIAEAMEEICG
jgi:pentatricopeptide repeat protein